eukprot:3654801-Amphidinium_carterae.1
MSFSTLLRGKSIENPSPSLIVRAQVIILPRCLLTKPEDGKGSQTRQDLTQQSYVLTTAVRDEWAFRLALFQSVLSTQAWQIFNHGDVRLLSGF